jgi:hypothetical protein
MVHVTGGVGRWGAVRTAELYDPVNGVWTETGLPGAARWGHTATLLASGRVVAAGGGVIGLSSAELFGR